MSVHLETVNDSLAPFLAIFRKPSHSILHGILREIFEKCAIIIFKIINFGPE